MNWGHFFIGIAVATGGCLFFLGMWVAFEENHVGSSITWLKGLAAIFIISTALAAGLLT